MRRILLAGRGTDRLARSLRDAGHEVVAVGDLLPGALVATAVQEDVDSVCLVAEGEEGEQVAEQVRAGLAAQGADDVALVALGGPLVEASVDEVIESLTAHP